MVSTINDKTFNFPNKWVNGRCSVVYEKQYDPLNILSLKIVLPLRYMFPLLNNKTTTKNSLRKYSQEREKIIIIRKKERSVCDKSKYRLGLEYEK